MEDEYHPELAGFEPYQRREHSRSRTYLMRAAVVVVIVALVMPGVATTYSVAESTAARACAYWAAIAIASQHQAAARFEAGGPGLLGWECYATTATGEEFVRSLGLIPVAPELIAPQGPAV